MLNRASDWKNGCSERGQSGILIQAGGSTKLLRGTEKGVRWGECYFGQEKQQGQTLSSRELSTSLCRKKGTKKATGPTGG